MVPSFERVKVTKMRDNFYLPLPKNVAELMKVKEGDELEVIGAEQAVIYKRVGYIGPIVIKR